MKGVDKYSHIRFRLPVPPPPISEAEYSDPALFALDSVSRLRVYRGFILVYRFDVYDPLGASVFHTIFMFDELTFGDTPNVAFRFGGLCPAVPSP